MTIDWLPGVIRLDATQDGGPQDLSYPPRLVLHTTEGGGTVQQLAAFYHTSTFWPHFTADIDGRVLAQHIPLSRGGRALSHTTATQTNDANCIQVEIIGRAIDAPHWMASSVDWLGHALKPVLDALGIKRVAPPFVANGAGLHAPQRMSETGWRWFNGVCGHEHVPENDHWDPGAMDIGRFLAATGAVPPAPVPHPPPPDVTIPIEDGMQQTDITMTVDAHGNGYKDLPGVKAVDVHSHCPIGVPDPQTAGSYAPIPRVSLTISPAHIARIVVEGGAPGAAISVRVIHA